MKILLIGIGSLGLISICHGQSNIVSGGNQASGSGGSITYSIGQVDYSNAESVNNNFNEGVQQPFDVTPLNDLNELELEVNIYPNPSSDKAIVKISNANGLDLSLQLFDAGGKLISEQGINSEETVLSLTDLAAGAYTIQITDTIKSQNFKLIKY
jgi:hypothetical protein